MGLMPKSGIAGTYGRLIFKFLRILLTDVQNGCTNLHPHQWRMRDDFWHGQHLLAVVLFISALLNGVRWNLKVALIWISLTANCDEQFLRYFLASLYLLLRTLHLYPWLIF